MAGSAPATKGSFSPRCEMLYENWEKVNRDMVTDLDAAKISIHHTGEV